MISQSFFNLEVGQAKKTEIDILEYLRNKKSEFENIIENGNISERFHCTLNNFINFEKYINEFKHKLLSNEIETWQQFESSMV